MPRGRAPHRTRDVRPSAQASRPPENLVPQDPDAEAAFLAGVIRHGQAAVEATEYWPHPDDFAVDDHRALYAAIGYLHEHGRPIQPDTVVDFEHELGQKRPSRAKARDRRKQVEELCARAPPVDELEGLARRISELAALRRLAQFGDDLAREARSRPADLRTFLREQRRCAEALWCPRVLPGTMVASTAELAEVVRETEWVWSPCLARGTVSMLAGDPGMGKTRLAHWWAAIYTGHGVAGYWPGAQRDPWQLAGEVLWIDTEGGQAAFVERCDQWGLDRSRFLHPGEQGLDDVRLDEPGAARELVELAARRVGGDLFIVVDSLSGGQSQSADTAATGRILRDLGLAARDLHVAVLVIHHLRQARPGESNEVTLDRLRGGSTVRQFPRVVLGLDQPDPDSPILRLHQVKGNLTSRRLDPIGVCLTDTGIEFCDPPVAPEREGAGTAGIRAVKLVRAMAFLRRALADGPQPARDLREQAEDQGIQPRTLQRAASEVHVRRHRSGRTWVWELPNRGSGEEGGG